MKLASLKAVRRVVLARSERGATATEYGLLVLFIALALVAGVTLFGAAINSLYGDLTTGVSAL